MAIKIRLRYSQREAMQFTGGHLGDLVRWLESQGIGSEVDEDGVILFCDPLTSLNQLAELDRVHELWRRGRVREERLIESICKTIGYAPKEN